MDDPKSPEGYFPVFILKNKEHKLGGFSSTIGFYNGRPKESSL